MSSPRLNTLVLLGGVLVYASIIFGGLDLGLVEVNVMTDMCKVSCVSFLSGYVKKDI